MFFFHSKQEVITRSYDLAGSGFSALPLKVPTPDSQEINSNVGTVRDITALFSSIFLSAIGFGILMVMIALKLNEFIKNEILMSISSAMQIFAGVVFARFLPTMGRKFGMVGTIYIGSIISAISAIIFYFYINYFWWILVIFIYGISCFINGVTRQTVISLGGMLVAVGNSLGPVLLEIIKTSDSFITFAIACSFFLTSILPLSRLKKFEGAIREEKRISLWRYIQNSPKIMFAGFCVNYVISSSNAFLIIYGIKIGMPEGESSLLLSIFLFGSIFSIPIAYMVDTLNRRFLMMFSALLSIICIYLLYTNQDQDRIYILLFIMFGCLMGTKLSAVVLINEKYKPTQRLAVNSAFAKISLCGNIFGIFLTGTIMKVTGSGGLWISSMFILSLFLIFCGLNYCRKILRKEYNIRYFSFFNKKNTNENFSEI